MGIVRTFWIALGVACLGAIGLPWGWAETAKPAAPAAVVFGKAVKTVEVSDELSYPARVVPKVNTTILAETDGVISRIPGVLGQRVKSHETLIVMTHTDPVYKYAPMRIVSPINGVVSAIEVSEGAQVSKGEKLASVTDPSKLRVVIEVPAEDLSSLKKGLAAQFKISGRAEPIAVRLQGLSPFVDPATGTATCEFEVDGTRSNLAAGVVGRLTLKVRQRKGIRIPEYAIIYRSQNPFVRIYEKGKLRLSRLTLGKKQDGQVEVLSGIKDGETVIERASRFVSEGESVQLDQGGEGHSS